MRYHCGVRFRLRVDVWMEAESLPDAEAVLSRVEGAAHDALGQAVRADDATGALSHAEMTAVDRAAVDALAAEDLGPGIASHRFTTPLASDEPKQ